MSSQSIRKKREAEELAEERYDNLNLLFTISYVITDTLIAFDLASNMALKKPVELYFYLRVLVAFFGLYGTLIYIAGNIFKDYCDCEFTCCCGKVFNNFLKKCGCHIFFGGLFLIVSYCIELCSFRVYYYNRDKIRDEFLVWLAYLLLIFSSITMILFCCLLINMRIEKKMKMKFD